MPGISQVKLISTVGLLLGWVVFIPVSSSVRVCSSLAKFCGLQSPSVLVTPSWRLLFFFWKRGNDSLFLHPPPFAPPLKMDEAWVNNKDCGGQGNIDTRQLKSWAEKAQSSGLQLHALSCKWQESFWDCPFPGVSKAFYKLWAGRKALPNTFKSCSLPWLILHEETLHLCSQEFSCNAA